MSETVMSKTVTSETVASETVTADRRLSESSATRPEGGVLYVVATPIGHLDDVSRRAADVLAGVEIIAAEDTRRTRSLLNALGLPVPRLIALHEHNETAVVSEVLAALRAGASVALVSDAGTPLVSDPGFPLVRDCYDAGIPVRPVPGPSAVAAALSVCPLPTTGSRFVGFLPARAGARRSRLAALIEAGDPVVFFEAPHRLRETLLEIAALAGDRRVFVAREMTKRFETYLVGTADELVARMDQADQWRGEMVCVLEGRHAEAEAGDREQARVMRILAAELPPAQAARLGAQILGVKKGALYRLVGRRERKSE